MIEAKPGDARGFLHKKIIGLGRGLLEGAVGGIPIVGPIARGIGTGIGLFPQPGAGGRRGFGRRPRAPLPQLFVEGIPLPVSTPGEGSACRRGEDTRCCQLRTGSIADQAEWQRECGTAGEQRGDVPTFGEAQMGQFGAGLQPATFQTTTRVCPRGAVLGMDGLCYNKRDIRNSERMWPRGTRPLLTGGEMRCIRIASSASNKIRRKTKQLEKMGMLPKPSRRARAALPAGHHAHVAHN